MTRRRTRLIAGIVLLLMLLAIMTAAIINYRATKHFGFETVAANSADTITPPEFLFSFAGSDKNRLVEPIGILRTGTRVYVADARQGIVNVYDASGRYLSNFGRGHFQTPLYISQNPVTGNLYISDRRKRELFIFKPDGTYVGIFNPNLPPNQRPKENTHGAQWAPVATAFAPDGRMYVTELLRGHRVVIFDKNGKFVRSVGDAGQTTKADANPLFFQFPNSIKVYKNEVWVVDSNNRRIQVLDLAGNFKKFVVTLGLPRGLAELPRRVGMSSTTPDRFVVVDTLSHDGTIFDANGERLLDFGEQGVLDGQFLFPDDASVDQGNSRIYITDTGNARVEVWGWPTQAEPVPTPHNAIQWGYCLSPLLLLLIPLFFRKRRFYASREFVEEMFEAQKIYTMPKRNRLWVVMSAEYEALKDLQQGEVKLGELLHPETYSDSDANALKDRYELPDALAAKMATAQRARYTLTEDPEVRRIAKILELDVMNRAEFLERFAKNSKNDTTPTAGVSGTPAETAPDAAQNMPSEPPSDGQ